MDITYMKAPKGVSSATIEGNEYDIPANGIIAVKNPGHLKTLKRHGFTETDAAVEPDWDQMSDEDLIAFIEEHGGEADDSMKTKKLIRLAKEAYAEGQEG